MSKQKISDLLSKTCFFWGFCFISNDIDPWLSKNERACKRAKTTFSDIRELQRFQQVSHHLDPFLCGVCVYLCGNYNIIDSFKLLRFLGVFHQMLRFEARVFSCGVRVVLGGNDTNIGNVDS